MACYKCTISQLHSMDVKSWLIKIEFNKLQKKKEKKKIEIFLCQYAQSYPVLCSRAILITCNYIFSYLIEISCQWDPTPHHQLRSPHSNWPTKSLGYQTDQLRREHKTAVSSQTEESTYWTAIAKSELIYMHLATHCNSHELHWNILDLQDNFRGWLPWSSGISAWNNSLASLRSFFQVLGSIPLFRSSRSPSQFLNLRILRESSLKQEQ